MKHWPEKSKCIIISIWLLASSVCGYCQEIKFRHLTPDEGLFSGNARAFLQDYQGFMWIGTDDGLYRYDGYEMVTFRSEKNNPHSLSDNFVLALFEDTYQNLWIGTLNGGLSMYDRKRNRFNNYMHSPGDTTSISGNSVRAIFEDNHKNLFVGSSALSILNLGNFNTSGTATFKSFSLDPVKDGVGDNWISSFAMLDEDKTWVGTTASGVLIFDPKKAEHGFISSAFSERNVQSIFHDSNNYTWIGTWEDGVTVYNEDFKKRKEIAPATLRSNLISHIEKDAGGNIWIASDNGLCKFEAGQDPFTAPELITYTHLPKDENSLLSNAIKAIYFDRDNRLWIASHFGGINIYDPNMPPFNSYHANIFEPRGLNHNNITSFARDLKGRLWIGTDGGGLNLVTAIDGKYRFDNSEKVSLVNPSTSKKADKIKCLTLDSDGNIWVGLWGSGLFRLNPDTRKYEHFGTEKSKQEQLVSNDIVSLLAEENNIWIGHFNGGLNYYDHDADSFKLFTSKSQSGIERINSIILADQPNKVWTGQELGGVNRYDADQGFVSTVENDLISKGLTIYAVHKSVDSTLWIGSTAYGLIKYNTLTEQTKIYGSDHGLTNYRIHAILEDDQRNLWLSTNQGLFKFDPDKELFTNYTKADGLLGNQFNSNSAIKLPDGLMIFGGINGLDYFYPEEIKSSNLHSPVALTGFWLNDQRIDAIDSVSPLKESILTASLVDLEYFQNSFSISFASLDYSQAKYTTYQYIMDGLDDRWQYLGSGRKVTFTDLSPGTYVLKVKALGREKASPEELKALTIVIHPAWWQTSWFTFGMVFLLGVALYLTQKFRLRFILAQRNKLKDLVELRTGELTSSNAEIIRQNKELVIQNEFINSQRLELEETHRKLEQINDQLEDLVEKRTLKLDKTLKELDSFVYSASHQLSAPLKTILGLLNIADLENNQEGIKKYHRHIETSIRKLENVIKNLADYSRNSHAKVVNEEFDLNKLVENVAAQIEATPEAENFTILNKVPKGFIVKTDLNRSEMVLNNLLGNSVKYKDESKPQPSVEISASSDEHHNYISIKDNGIGIARENQERVFEMYFRATERSTGSGLGLFIVKEIVATAGGKISLQSTFGEGTTFTIQFSKN